MYVFVPLFIMCLVRGKTAALSGRRLHLPFARTKVLECNTKTNPNHAIWLEMVVAGRLPDDCWQVLQFTFKIVHPD